MSYTVNKVAKLSGISVRTLHFYDEIGLLKPSYVGENNYRYYKDDALLKLQQILLYRKLGFSLNKTQEIISDQSFDKIKALESHKLILEKNLDQTSNLIKTIDKTIAHLRGKQKMKLEEIFEGFDAEKQVHYENFLVESGVSQNVIDNVKDKVSHWGDGNWIQIKKEGDALYADLATAIDQHLKPESIEVQKLIKKHYELTKQFWTPNKESYIGLSQLYGSHPDFVKFYQKIHPKLLDFLSEAMMIYANQNLR